MSTKQIIALVMACLASLLCFFVWQESQARMEQTQALAKKVHELKTAKLFKGSREETQSLSSEKQLYQLMLEENLAKRQIQKIHLSVNGGLMQAEVKSQIE